MTKKEAKAEALRLGKIALAAKGAKSGYKVVVYLHQYGQPCYEAYMARRDDNRVVPNSGVLAEVKFDR